jgi:hypothetical protein
MSAAITVDELQLVRSNEIGDSYSRTDFDFYERVLRSCQIPVENSTSLPRYQETIDEHVERLFASAGETEFAFGIENDFTNRIRSTVETYGDDAIRALSSYILFSEINDEIAAEALRCLGRLSEPTSYRMRLWLLEKGLFSESPEIRDSASLGLASLDDPEAIPYLLRAIQHEPSEELLQSMKQVLEQLETTARHP